MDEIAVFDLLKNPKIRNWLMRSTYISQDCLGKLLAPKNKYKNPPNPHSKKQTRKTSPKNKQSRSEETEYTKTQQQTHSNRSILRTYKSYKSQLSRQSYLQSAKSRIMPETNETLSTTRPTIV